MRLGTLGIIIIGIGVVNLFSALASYMSWQKEYDRMSEVVAHFNKTKALEDCYYQEHPCYIPSLPDYDNTITIRTIAGSIIGAGGGAVVICGMRKEDKGKV